MSSRPAKEATETPTTSKKKTPASNKAGTAPRKKVTRSGASKKTERSSTPKKKTASKKVTGKQAASRKVTGKKVAGKKAPAKKASRKEALRNNTATATETAADAEPKSISWMSAQASSALKAVKANQAVKGQAVIAKNRKQEGRQPIDDASLIEIADGMPTDDAALLEFAAEDLQQEPAQTPTNKTNKGPSKDTAATPAVAEQVAATDQKETPMAETRPEESSDQTPEETTTDMPPPPPAGQQKTHWPAMLAVLLVATILVYVFWPGVKEGSMMEAVIDRVRTPESPAAVTTAAPAEVETVEVLSSTVVDTQEEPSMPSDTVPPAVTDDAWIPANLPPGVPDAATPASPAPAPMADEQPPAGSAVAGQVAPEPIAAEQAAAADVVQQAPDSMAPPATAAAPAVTSPAPAAPAPRAAPAAPAGYPAQGYGYYPQPRQPAYPQQYYRQYR